GWQRAVLVEGMIAVGVVLVLAGAATPWTIVVLPIVVAVLVKLNDVVVGGLQGTSTRPKPASGSAAGPATPASLSVRATATSAAAPQREREKGDARSGRRPRLSKAEKREARSGRRRRVRKAGRG